MPDIATLEQSLGYTFRRPELLEKALTHTSGAREREMANPGAGVQVGDNEQLEFLGDAVLALVTAEELCRRYAHFREGRLSKLRAHLVSARHLVKVARALDLGTYLRLGRGEEKSGGRHKPAMLADAVEAILAALYLDGGFEAARRFVLDVIVTPELDHLSSGGGALPVTDFKSALQELLQARSWPQPNYVLVHQEGPEHKKVFTVEVRVNRAADGDAEFAAHAQGSTKKKAEQEAARQALDHLTAPESAAVVQHE
jgi:ribonuclease-3